MKSFSLSNQQISLNINKIVNFMESENISLFFISSQDEYLNEYTPLWNNHRYYFTGFTGSTADVLITKDKQVFIFVDGRYHEQVDNEIDSKMVTSVKCELGVSNFKLLIEKAIEIGGNIAYEGDRISRYNELRLAESLDIIKISSDDLGRVIDFEREDVKRSIWHLKEIGESSREKVNKVLGDSYAHEGMFLTALDSIAWLSNCLGFHLPNQSVFKSKAFVTYDKIYIFVESGVEIDSSDEFLEFVEMSRMEDCLKDLKNKQFDKIYYDKRRTTAFDFNILSAVFSVDRLKSLKKGPYQYHSIKIDWELDQIKDSFNKANQTIFNTINWVKGQVCSGAKISELDFYNIANNFYKKGGSVSLSFDTISAVGKNSSIIHFSSPSDDIVIKDDICLLDSGAIYENGFSTDTTRTFFVGCTKGAKPTSFQKKIYTLVLKGLIAAESAVVRPQTPGAAIDAIARYPILRSGYDYMHGTGHGVGINVHEDGIGFSGKNQSEIKVGQVISIEPGIYLPGEFGVRLENIVTVVPSRYEGMFEFQPLVYIGYDWSLINLKMLDSHELEYLNLYEQKCKERGTRFDDEY